MNTRPRAWLVGVVAVSALVAAACGGTGSSSPTSPFGSLSSTAGATISGLVAGGGSQVTASKASTGPTASPAATNGIIVTVSGTNLSATVDNLGHFVLLNVPSGTIRLDFTGGGRNATVSIPGVSAGDRIEIVVSLNGSNATLENHLVELEGQVSGLTGSCPSLSFTVRGRQVATNSATSFREGACTQIQNNADVEVKGQRQGDGSLLAIRVEVGDNDGDDDDDDDNEDADDDEVKGAVSGLTGTCPTLTFVVNGRTIVTNSSTRFERGCSVVQNGRRVEVEGVPQTNGSLLATEVELDD